MSENGTRIVLGRERSAELPSEPVDVVVIESSSLEVVKALPVRGTNDIPRATFVNRDASIVALGAKYNYDNFPSRKEQATRYVFDSTSGDLASRREVPRGFSDLQATSGDVLLFFGSDSVTAVDGVTLKTLGRIDAEADRAQDCGDGRLGLIDESRRLFHLVDKSNWSVLTSVKLKPLSNVIGSPPAIDPQCERVVGFHDDEGLALVDTKSGALITQVRGFSAAAQPRYNPVTGLVYAATYTSEEGTSVVALDPLTLEVVETLDSEGLKEIEKGPYCLFEMSFSPDGSTLALLFQGCGDTKVTDFDKIALYRLAP